MRQLLCLFIRTMIEPVVAVIEAYLCYELHTEFCRILCEGDSICREIIGDCQCVFRRNVSTADPIFRIRQTFEEKNGHTELQYVIYL